MMSLAVASLLVIMVACTSGGEPTASPSRTRSPEPSAVVTPTHMPSPSPSPTADAALIPAEPTGPELSGEPASATGSDNAFALTLAVSQDRYRAGQLIEAQATLAYLGQGEVVMRGSGSSLVGFGVERAEPPLSVGPAYTSDCVPYPISAGRPLVYPFTKSGGFSPGDPDDAFPEAFLSEPDFRLPAGTWTIWAESSFYTGADCGEALHELRAEVTITVEP